MRGAKLRNAVLVGATLRGADLSGAQLTDADLTDADLSGATLRGANLTGATVRDAILVGAELTGADLTGADLHGANLEGADLTAAQGCDVTRRLPRCRVVNHEYLASGGELEAFLRDGTVDPFTAGVVDAVLAAVPAGEQPAFIEDLGRIDLNGDMSALMANGSFRRLLEITGPLYDAEYGSSRAGRLLPAAASTGAQPAEPVEQLDPFESARSRYEEKVAYLRRWLGERKEKLQRIWGWVSGLTVADFCLRTPNLYLCAIRVGVYIGMNIQTNDPGPESGLYDNIPEEELNWPSGRKLNDFAQVVSPCSGGRCERNTDLDDASGGDLSFTSTVRNRRFVVGRSIGTFELPGATGGVGRIRYSLSPEVPGLTFRESIGREGGHLSGRPREAGESAMTYTATDNRGMASLEFTITVMAVSERLSWSASVRDQTYVVGRAIEPLTVPEASGGVPPVTYQCLLLPGFEPEVAGLRFDGRTLTGTPTEAGRPTQGACVATDDDGATATLQFTITVRSAPEPLAFVGSVPDQTYVVGTPFETPLPEARGGTPPLSYQVVQQPAAAVVDMEKRNARHVRYADRGRRVPAALAGDGCQRRTG